MTIVGEQGVRENLAKRLLREGKTAIGGWVVSDDPTTTEIMADVGFDFVVVDTEHAAIRDSQVGDSRTTATNASRSVMRVYRASIAMGLGAPVLWVTLIAPGANLAAAARIARGQFGAARLLSLVEHPVPRRIC